MQQRMKWDEICRRSDLRGRWIALDGCQYDSETGDATEGAVVDSDPNLAELVHRVREGQFKNCAILFCGGVRPRRGSYPPNAA